MKYQPKKTYDCPRILLGSYSRSGSSLYLSTVLREYPTMGFESELRQPDAFVKSWGTIANIPETPQCVIAKEHMPVPDSARDIGCVMMIRCPRETLHSHYRFTQFGKHQWGPKQSMSDWLRDYHPRWEDWHLEHIPKLKAIYGDRFLLFRHEWVKQLTYRHRLITGTAYLLREAGLELPRIYSTADTFNDTWARLHEADDSMYSGLGDAWMRGAHIDAEEYVALVTHCDGAMGRIASLCERLGVTEAMSEIGFH